MQVLIADSLAPTAVAELESMGCAVQNKPSLSADDLPGAIAGVNVLIVRSTKVTSAVFEAADSLALVVRAGAGVNTIDLEAASSRKRACSKGFCDASSQVRSTAFRTGVR